MPGPADASSQAHQLFTNFIYQYEPTLKRYALHEVKQSSFLQSPDEDDIYILTLKKLWSAYFAPDAAQRYKRRSDSQDLALLRLVVKSIASDMRERKGRDNQVLAWLEIDAQIESNEEDSGSYNETIGTGTFTELVDLEIDLEQAIECAITNPVHKLVAYYLWGRVEREQLSEYSDNYIRVTAHRVRKILFPYLNGQM